MHALVIDARWDVAPHPQATDRAKGRASFREHDIESFPGGMRRRRGPRCRHLMHDWIADAGSAARRRATEFPEALADCTPASSRSTRSSTATAAPGACSSTSCWSGSDTRRRSSTRATAPGTWAPCAAPTRATSARSANSSPARCSTTSTSSSSRRLAGPARLVPLPALATDRAVRQRAARGGDPRTAEGRQGRRRDLAQLTRLGRRVHRHPLQAQLTPRTDQPPARSRYPRVAGHAGQRAGCVSGGERRSDRM